MRRERFSAADSSDPFEIVQPRGSYEAVFLAISKKP